jgi:tRNA (cmo5U34)-methyltransferase
VTQFHFSPSTYLDEIRRELSRYDELQDAVAAATERRAVRRILDLGAGTGETAARVLARHPEARVVLLDEHPGMLDLAADRLAGHRVESMVTGDLLTGLPDGPFDLAISALAVHHLDAGRKQSLFRRLWEVLGPRAGFVLGDVVVPERPADAVTPLTPGIDRPDPLPALLQWLEDAGFDPTVTWEWRDLAVVRAERVDAHAARR